MIYKKVTYFITIILLCLVYTQSIYNSYGLGLSRTSFNTAVSGAGSIGLVPTFHPGVSLENSATWPGLNFSYINSSFGNQLFGNEINNTKTIMKLLKDYDSSSDTNKKESNCGGVAIFLPLFFEFVTFSFKILILSSF